MITVTLIPILSDNYAYLLESDDGAVAIVDPGEAGPILKALEKRNLIPNMILITHYHGDHVAGLDDILARHDCRVIGKNHDDVSEFSFGSETVRIFDTPGHKRDHVCFYFDDSGIAFTGDTLFAMGCGRILDGTAEELYESLQTIAALPDDTKIYCGHEYTHSNAAFCAHAVPENEDIQARLTEIKALREAGTPTLPSSIGLEKKTNVFLMAKTAQEFATLRKAKDRF